MITIADAEMHSVFLAATLMALRLLKSQSKSNKKSSRSLTGLGSGKDGLKLWKKGSGACKYGRPNLLSAALLL